MQSSLFGHDSHGVLRLYEYVEQVEGGHWDPQAGEPTVREEHPCSAVVDGGGAMGQVAGNFATRIAIDKARENGVATVTLRNTKHLGRCGAYPLMAAEEGLVCLAFVNAGGLGCQITPFGGLDGKLSTNPIAFAAPRRNADPIMVDMATAATAEGKIRIARNRGQHLPEGWIIDRDGAPATDPDAFLEEPRGAMLPLGGPAAHKGYCLGVIVEVLGGALGGEGCAAGLVQMKSNGVLMNVYNIEHFTTREAYYEEVETLVDHIHTSRVDPAVGEILLPGEPEFRSAREKETSGIAIDDTTWSRIGAAAKRFGLDASEVPQSS